MTLGKKIKFIPSKYPSSKYLKGNFVILEPINIEKISRTNFLTIIHFMTLKFRIQ